jgi:hypothetical protein
MRNTKIAPGPEIWFRAIGTALAGASLAFAGYMLAYGGGKVRVNGTDHLAIFAQPRGPTTAGVTEIAALRGVEPLGKSAGLPDRGADAPAPRPARIVAARPDRVWLMIGGVIRSASPNDDVPGIGRISAIVRRNDGWALLDDRGTTLLTVANDANGAQLFSRRLIFE